MKGKGDPLKQRLVSRTQCRLCGEGHREEDCPQPDVDMPQAKRRVTFSRPVLEKLQLLGQFRPSPRFKFWNSRKIRRVVRSSLGAECAALSTVLEHTDMFRVLYGELSGDLCDLAEYETYLQTTDALCVNAISAASKTSEDKHLGIELSMIKQRLFRNETRFQWVEGATMPVDVLTKGKERGHVELLRKLLHTARYQIRATSEMLEERRQARERKSLRHQERRKAGV